MAAPVNRTWLATFLPVLGLLVMAAAPALAQAAPPAAAVDPAAVLRAVAAARLDHGRAVAVGRLRLNRHLDDQGLELHPEHVGQHADRQLLVGGQRQLSQRTRAKPRSWIPQSRKA
jgi:sulfite reductase beta subunit-like hemoprotein